MRIVSVNIGAVRDITVKNLELKTGIFKSPTPERVPVSYLGLRDDIRVTPRKMGEEHHAVYAYPLEHYAYWQEQLQREPFPMGQFGENLTVTGLLEEEVRIGDVFRVGNTVLQIAQPRIPCGKLNARMGTRFAPVFLASRKVGYYLRVIEEGDVGAGDRIDLLERDDASPTMEEFVRIVQYEYWDNDGLERLLRARGLMPAWRKIIEAKLSRARSQSGWHGLRELEVVKREDEGQDIVSLYLRCYRGRPLAPFSPGQQLGIVIGARGFSSQQRRRSYAISSDPTDISAYRISVARIPADDADDADDSSQTVSEYLTSASIGDRLLCASPHGSGISYSCVENLVPVLICEGLGIAPMTSILHELQQREATTVHLWHARGPHTPQRIFSEATSLIERNEGYTMTSLDDVGQFSAEAIGNRVALDSADFFVAGPRKFADRIIAELSTAGVIVSGPQVWRF